MNSTDSASSTTEPRYYVVDRKVGPLTAFSAVNPRFWVLDRTTGGVVDELTSARAAQETADAMNAAPPTPRPRTPEDGHTLKCLAAAMVAAIENERDMLLDEVQGRRKMPESSADYSFRLWVQDNGPLTTADGYLADGTFTCLCPPLY